MGRSYTLRKRAEKQAETRRRIVEAAVDLHGSVGPAATTVSQLAAKAGVQRHTVYAHFPDERSLLMACSGLAAERDPPPDPQPLREIADPGERLRAGLAALYDWYGRNAELLACVLRDAEFHAPTREVVELRNGAAFAAYAELLGEGLGEPARAMLHLALGFHAWRALREQGMSEGEAAELMASAIRCVNPGFPA